VQLLPGSRSLGLVVEYAGTGSTFNSRLANQALTVDWQLAEILDDDGVSTAIEDAAPNGGDGNGDGIPDSQQAHVASLPDGEDAGYVTAELTGGCAELLNVAAISEDEATIPDPAYDYSNGLVEFELPCEVATVELLFHGGSFPNATYRKYGPTTPGDPLTDAWYDFPDATFSTRDIGGNTVAVVELTLRDGYLGDDTGFDSMIVDVGGPAAFVPPLCSDGIDNDSDGDIDYPADRGCWNAESDIENPECDDGINNDPGVDSATDFPADRGCFAAASNDESPVCDDGIDNDGDGDVDFPEDLKCVAGWGPSEDPKPLCGLGAELLLLLPALMWLHRRRKSRPW
jgi:hypothetical protein